jgi:coenzyme F420-dependent glucose-6-phosphate dehydrogenase
MSTAPDSSIVDNYREAGGEGPIYGQVTCCWTTSEEEAKTTAQRVWPNAAIKGDLSQELALPAHFEQAAENVSPDDVAEAIALGPDPLPYVELARKYVEAGFDHIAFHQVGSDQDGFFRFWSEELATALQAEISAAA